jgi:hypothetical protein
LKYRFWITKGIKKRNVIKIFISADFLFSIRAKETKPRMRNTIKYLLKKANPKVIPASAAYNIYLSFSKEYRKNIPPRDPKSSNITSFVIRTIRRSTGDMAYKIAINKAFSFVL